MLKDKSALGQTGLEVSPLCLGCGSYGGSMKEPLAVEMMDYYYELGGRFLDTAVIYCDWFEGERSSSQNIIGRWMQARKNRKELVLSVKGCNGKIITPTNDLATAPRTDTRLHREDIIEDIEVSMKNLRTDYLDIFTLHHDNESVEIAEILETLQEQKKRGVIRAYGCSNWKVERQREAYDYAKAHGLDGFMVDQINWSLNVFAPGSKGAASSTVMGPEASRFHQETGIPAMAYGANGRGYLHCLANGLPVREQDHKEYDCPQNEKILAVLKQAAQDLGVEVNTLALGYLMQGHGFQVIPIVGIKSKKEMEIAAAAADCHLPQEVLDQLSQLRGLNG